jgi:putative transposase
MPDYIRARVEGGTYFFTGVTYERQRFLTWEVSRSALRQAITAARKNHPFQVEAWVLLPDHFHCIWTLPAGDADYSTRWNIIKAGFSSRMKETLQRPERLSASRTRRRELGIWQRRFWEHLIRDDEDWRRHMDYVHYNPVKHGLARQAADWPYSSFHRLVASGHYPRDWGTAETFDLAAFGDVS